MNRHGALMSRPPASDRPVPAVQLVEVTEPSAGQRLDNFLLRRLKGVPKTMIYRIIRKGEVRVNGGRAKPELKLRQGDKVRIPPVRQARAGDPVSPGQELRARLREAVLLEDEHLLVINKPSGLAVHAGTGGQLGVIEAFRSMYPEHGGLELVHRLDKGTSGCLLLSKTGKARKALTLAFRSRDVEKRYHLIVSGRWPAAVTQVDMPLQRRPERGGERRVVSDAEGKSASTEFRILRTYGKATLLEASPATGRTHQIRVHAAETGHPLLGEDKYQSAHSAALSKALGIRRLCLHAAQLSFAHPLNGKLLTVNAPYDDSFSRAVEQVAAGD